MLTTPQPKSWNPNEEQGLHLITKHENFIFNASRFTLDSPDEQVLFVLTQLPNSKQIILLSSDLELTGEEVIEAYSWRFKIEVCFRTLVHR